MFGSGNRSGDSVARVVLRQGPPSSSGAYIRIRAAAFDSHGLVPISVGQVYGIKRHSPRNLVHLLLL